MLTAEQKEKVLEDFASWSGGCSPDECDEDEVRTYLRVSLVVPEGASKKDAKAFVIAIAVGLDENDPNVKSPETDRQLRNQQK